MDITEFRKELKTGKLSRWYILSGEEDYLKKYYANELRSMVCADEAFSLFNYASFDGEDIDFGAVVEAIKSPPMRSEYKLVEWKFAPLDSLKESQKNALESLFDLKEEYPYAIFVITATSDGFDAGTAKRPSKLALRLSSAFDIVSFPKSTDSQLLTWLKKHFDAEGVSVQADVLHALLFRSGHSMEVLNNEVIKLCSLVKSNGRTALSVADVEAAASPTVECDAFALSNAVLERNAEAAFVALTDLKQRRVEPQIIIAMLERIYSELSSVAILLEEGHGAAAIESILKIHTFKAKIYINAAKRVGAKRLASTLTELCRIDAASKSGGVSGYGAIEMFIAQNF